MTTSLNSFAWPCPLPIRLAPKAAALLMTLFPLLGGGVQASVALGPESASAKVLVAQQVSQQPLEAKIGVLIEESGQLNQSALVQEWVNHVVTYKQSGIEYKSECKDPNRYIPSSIIGPTVLMRSEDVRPYKQSSPRIKGRFISQKTFPAPGLRVIIRNQIPGLAPSQLPYTNREYDQGLRSEAFFMAPGDRHSGKYLAVQDGPNTLTYEIKRGEQVLESGEFTVTLKSENRYITRRETLPRDVVKITCPEYDKQQKQKPPIVIGPGGRPKPIRIR